MFAKLLAICLELLLLNLIGLEQCGFVKGRLTSDNSRLLLNVLNKAPTLSYSLAAVSIDSGKAFDRVGWFFLFKALHWHGFGPKCISLISLLYTIPRVSLTVKGLLSQFFLLQRGVRQGCPLSPLLFILSLEPFLSHIRQNTSISGFLYSDQHFNLSAYAEDILLFISKNFYSSFIARNLRCFPSFRL